MRDLSSVLCIVSSDEKYRAIDEIISSCSVFDELPDKERFRGAVHRRERIQSTGIGHGVAIAHGKVPGIDHPIAALGFSRDGIIFDDRYPDPVKLIFVIASSPSHESDYLKAVASILSWVHDPDFRKMLVECAENETTERFLTMMRTQDFVPQNPE